MHTTQASRQIAVSIQDLERWDRWLQERLAPAIVVLTDSPGFAGDEYRWTVNLQRGVRSVMRVPRSLVEASPNEFRRVTDGLASYPLALALEKSGVDGLRLVCPDV